MRLVHCKVEPYEVYIGRPSKWGNPFEIGKHGNRIEVIEAYRQWIANGDGQHLLRDLHELKGKVLGCWCKPQPCHGEVLMDLIAKHCP